MVVITLVEGLITFYGFMLAVLEAIVNIIAIILTGILLFSLAKAFWEGMRYMKDIYQEWRMRSKAVPDIPVFFLLNGRKEAQEVVNKLNEQYVRWELKRSYKMNYGRVYRIVPTTRKEESNEK